MRNFLKWTWRVMLVVWLATMFLSNLAILQVSLMIGIIIGRVILVETDNTVY